MIKQLRITITSIFLLFPFIVNAQTTDLAGKITASEDGSPLPGVSVIIKGTKLGTSTDLNGMYKLSVPKKAILQISFVGFETVEQAVSNKTVLDFSLKSDVKG